MHKIALYSKAPQYSGLLKYYDHAKDIRIWIDGKEYLDFSPMGFSTNILGYRDNYVNFFVKRAISRGNISSLNPRIDQKFSSLLLAIHHWADIVRFAKTGGEAMKIALDLAVEKTWDDIYNNNYEPYILTCGYNGWHLKERIADNCFENIKNVNDILTFPSQPNIFVFELIRHEFPKPKVIELLKEWQSKGTILILDEITSGFRFSCGGVHLLYGLEPDICVFAKGMSNGYPMAAIIGKEKYMESDLWISSTYWSESIGSTAGYYTMKKLKSCNYTLLRKLGQAMQMIWKRLAKEHRLKIKINEVPNIAKFEFDYDNNFLLKNLYIEYMLSQGVLASNQFYPSFAHKNKHFNKYIIACDKAFAFVKKHLKEPEKVIKNRMEELNK